MSDSERALVQGMPDEMVTRRRFLSRISLGLSALAGAVVGIPIVSYLLSPLLFPAAPVWQNVGPVNGFKVGETVQVALDDPSALPWAGQTAQTAAWLRRDSADRFTAFSVHCTHLGCPVNWRPDSSLFLCPCHGGVYYADGTVAAGPPPRPLFEHAVRVQDGAVEIRTGALPLA
jgi:menaquinol-cytochrome c reductase iron-sulfur subunit